MTINANDFMKTLQFPPELVEWAEKQPQVQDVLPTLPAGDLLDMPLPPRNDIFGEALLFNKSLTALIAPPGTGKTRAALQIAICSLCGIDFGPLTVPQRTLRWLMLAGNENSLLRYQTDLKNMLEKVPEDARELVLQNIHFHVVSDIDDFITGESMDRIRETCKELRPDAVILDPLGDIVQGDANADTDMRASLRSFSRAIWSGNTDAAILLVHHAREGSQNIRQAIGWDRGNYGKGSKALIAACRATINMAPKTSENDGGIVVAAGKVNDAPRFDAFAMDYQDGWYVQDDAWVQSEWEADVDGKRGSVQTCTIQEIVNYIEAQPGKVATQKQIAEHFEVSPGTVNARVKMGVKNRYLKKSKNGVRNTGKLKAVLDVEHFEED